MPFKTSETDISGSIVPGFVCITSRKTLVYSLLLLFVLFILVCTYSFFFSGEFYTPLANKPSPLLHSSETRGESLSSCRRRCPHGRRNKILYLGPGGAGIGDRVYIIQHLIELAGYLCATVMLRSPSFNLAAAHNENKLVSPKMGWKDFLDLRFYDNQLSLLDLNVSADWSGPKRNPHKFHVSQEMLETLVYSELARNAPTGVSIHLSKKGPQIAALLQELVPFVAAQAEGSNIFVWGINMNFYHFWRQYAIPAFKSLEQTLGEAEALSLPHRCQYSKVKGLHASDQIRSVASDIWKQLIANNSNVQHFGHLHIRRGDAIDQCNTSLTHMVEFFNCSLRDTQMVGPLCILFSSDERNFEYRRAIQDMVIEAGHEWIDLDGLVREKLAREFHPDLVNNYLIFTTIVSVTNDNRVHFRLQKHRRYSCPDCINVRDIIMARTQAQSGSG